MNQTEFEDLLNCHGSDLTKWPEPFRTAAHEALGENPTWFILVESAESLEQKLDSYLMTSVDLVDLEQEILKQTVHKKTMRQLETHQQPLLDQFLNWLLPEKNLWRPALVACLPIMMGLSIGLSMNIDDSFTLEEELSLTGLEFIAWESEE
jgi:hypothetical protein